MAKPTSKKFLQRLKSPNMLCRPLVVPYHHPPPAEATMAPPASSSEAIPRQSLRKMVRNARFAMEKREQRPTRRGKRAQSMASDDSQASSTPSFADEVLHETPALERKGSGEGDASLSYIQPSVSLHTYHHPNATKSEANGIMVRQGSTGTSLGSNQSKQTTGTLTSSVSKTIIGPLGRPSPSPHVSSRPQRGAADAVVPPPPPTHRRATPDAVVPPPPAIAATVTLESLTHQSSSKSENTRPGPTPLSNSNGHISFTSFNSSISSVTFNDLCSMAGMPLRPDSVCKPLSLEDDGDGHVQMSNTSVTNIGHSSACSIISELSASHSELQNSTVGGSLVLTAL